MAAKPFSSGHILAAADVNDLTGVIDRSPAQLDIVSSALAANLYYPTIPAGALSTDRKVRMTLGGDILQNATAIPTISVYYGATILWQSAIGFGNDADRHVWRMTVEMQNINSASVQWMDGEFVLGDASAAAVGTGTQFITPTTCGHLVFGAAGALNSALALGFGVIVKWDVSSANASFRRRRAVLELL